MKEYLTQDESGKIWCWRVTITQRTRVLPAKGDYSRELQRELVAPAVGIVMVWRISRCFDRRALSQKMSKSGVLNAKTRALVNKYSNPSYQWGLWVKTRAFGKEYASKDPQRGESCQNMSKIT